MVRAKVCGITNIDDAMLAVRLGAHALGFVFAQSPRQIDLDSAREIIGKIPPFVQAVGVFVNEDEEEIRKTAQFCGLDLVQLHGEESPEVCKRLMPRVIKSVRVKGPDSLLSIEQYKGNVRALLLDSWSAQSHGGTGKSFDWGLALEAKQFNIPIILSGGLNASNIKEAAQIHRLNHCG